MGHKNVLGDITSSVQTWWLIISYLHKFVSATYLALHPLQKQPCALECFNFLINMYQEFIGWSVGSSAFFISTNRAVVNVSLSWKLVNYLYQFQGCQRCGSLWSKSSYWLSESSLYLSIIFPILLIKWFSEILENCKSRESDMVLFILLTRM